MGEGGRERQKCGVRQDEDPLGMKMSNCKLIHKWKKSGLHNILVGFRIGLNCSCKFPPTLPDTYSN